MNSPYVTVLFRLLLALALTVPFGAAQADIVGTDQATVQSQDRQEASQGTPSARDRAEVKKQLEALGVDPETAQKRVDALTDEEVQRIAGRLDTAPAGGTLSQTEWILILLIAILVAIAI